MLSVILRIQEVHVHTYLLYMYDEVNELMHLNDGTIVVYQGTITSLNFSLLVKKEPVILPIIISFASTLVNR